MTQAVSVSANRSWRDVRLWRAAFLLWLPFGTLGMVVLRHHYLKTAPTLAFALPVFWGISTWFAGVAVTFAPCPVCTRAFFRTRYWGVRLFTNRCQSCGRRIT